MSLPHAVIIAGGRGDRLGGVRKADLLVGGKRLVDRVATAIGPVAGPLMLSIGKRDDWRTTPAGMLAIPDIDSETGGPLAGLAAAVADLQARGVTTGLLVSAAVDTPFLPPSFVATMTAALEDAPATYAAWQDQFYPPNAVWRLEALAELPAQLRHGEAPRSLKTLLQAIGARQVPWHARGGSNPFANINTLADLVALGWINRQSEPS